MFRILRAIRGSTDRVPPDVLCELVDIVFTMRIPVVFMGLTVAAAGALVATRNDDLVVASLSVATVLVAAGRAFLIRAYQHRVREISFADNAAIWERRYAVGSHASAILLAAFNVFALATDDSLVPMLVTALTFGYGAGLVTRVSVRPALCVTSLGLAVIPTVIAFAAQAIRASDHYTMAMFAGQAVVIAGFSLTSLESVSHIYRTNLKQLIAKQDLAILAGQDTLTGLPNRTLLRARLNESIVQLRRENTVLAYHCLDLDRFKSVNDTLGHPAGDALLKEVAARLANILRSNDTAARVGGDEFVILQMGIMNNDEARLFARRIIRALGAPYTIDDHEVNIGVSVGIALAPRDGVTFDRLTAHGDAALYEAKRQGRGRVVIAGEEVGSAGKISAA